MTHHIFELLRDALAQYGYWALGVILLLENMGIPVPGETILLLASFLAYSHGELQLGWIIFVGTLAATIGDNLGYAIGFRGGRPLLEKYQRVFRISPQVLAKGDELFSRYGSVTVLFSRFVFGMRIIAGPLAGVLRMPWRKFFLFNFLGAVLWVSVISTVGYLFGRHWERFAHDLKIVDIAIISVAVLVIAFFWWRNRRPRSD
jgi:membrane protein DedA with SNARE-associated domain